LLRQGKRLLPSIERMSTPRTHTGGTLSNDTPSGERVSQREAAERIGASPTTLRRWVQHGLVPQYDGADGWTPAAVRNASVIARMRARGHSLSEIRRALEEGRLAYAYTEELLASPGRAYKVADAARETGIEPALAERIVTTAGFNADSDGALREEDVQLLRYAAKGLEAGLPLVALLQMIRVYGQAIAQIADAEVRLFHLYVHEPLMRSGATGLEVADEMRDLAGVLLPLSSPVMVQIHERYLRHFIEQDVVGHMEVDLDGNANDPGRMRIAIAFADLTGYTRLTEEAGELEALDAVERFVQTVAVTLPDEARVVKSIGDEVMIVSADPATLTDWAVGFQGLQSERPRPRIGIHFGNVLYRDGDYFGRDVNIAARVAARSAGGEVLVTRPVVERAGPHLEFDRIGEIKLKGFSVSTEMFVAHPLDEEE
jgi:adenylate cyclase